MKVIVVAFFCIFLIIISAVESNSSLESKIIGGVPVQDLKSENLRSVVSLRYLYKHICGGCLIFSRTVLSAAHCIYFLRMKPNLKDFEVVAGSIQSGAGYGIWQTVKHINTHYLYKPLSKGGPFDIGLVILEHPLGQSDYVSVAKLLKSDVLPGTNATIAGWGSVTTTLEKEKDHQLSQILRSLKVEVKPKDWCTSHLGDMSDNQFCTWYDKSANADFGDCGSPLILHDVVIGINTFSKVGKPATFAKVSHFLPYISAARKLAKNARRHFSEAGEYK